MIASFRVFESRSPIEIESKVYCNLLLSMKAKAHQTTLTIRYVRAGVKIRERLIAPLADIPRTYAQSLHRTAFAISDTHTKSMLEMSVKLAPDSSFSCPDSSTNL